MTQDMVRKSKAIFKTGELLFGMCLYTNYMMVMVKTTGILQPVQSISDDKK